MWGASRNSVGGKFDYHKSKLTHYPPPDYPSPPPRASRRYLVAACDYLKRDIIAETDN
jgi:hypothetical protein